MPKKSSTSFQLGGKKSKSSASDQNGGKKKKPFIKHKSTYEGKTRREMRHDVAMEREKSRGNPENVKEREKTKRSLAYAGAATGASSAASEAAKVQVIDLSEGGINPTTTPKPNTIEDEVLGI